MLNVTRLRVLHEVARLGSLTAAAKELSYTISAVSQQITLLERETGSELLERQPRGVRLTEAGRVLVAHAGTVLSELRAAAEAVQAVNLGHGGRLRFGSFPTANAALMPRAVAEFRERHPEVELVLTELDRDEGLTTIGARELDIVLVYEFPVVPIVVPDNIEVHRLLVDPLHIMLPSDHPLASRKRLRLTDLADQHWIQGVHHGSTMDVLPRACRAAGFEPDIVFRTDDQMTVRGLVAAGLGIALAPWLALSAVPAGIVARPLREPTLTRTVLVALPAAASVLPAASAMVDALRSAGAALGDILPRR
ncbi:MAG: LysR family transcriptional regulator [Pseudonocardiaceae bacterium]|nr:LysR family transcriptional regulator [Pseudonocardiaceae bacterium]